MHIVARECWFCDEVWLCACCIYGLFNCL